eukprot:2282645-Rhodomonas_salina.3
MDALPNLATNFVCHILHEAGADHDQDNNERDEPHGLLLDGVLGRVCQQLERPHSAEQAEDARKLEHAREGEYAEGKFAPTEEERDEDRGDSGHVDKRVQAHEVGKSIVLNK